MGATLVRNGRERNTLCPGAFKNVGRFLPRGRASLPENKRCLPLGRMWTYMSETNTHQRSAAAGAEYTRTCSNKSYVSQFLLLRSYLLIIAIIITQHRATPNLLFQRLTNHINSLFPLRFFSGGPPAESSPSRFLAVGVTAAASPTSSSVSSPPSDSAFRGPCAA